MGSIEVVLNYTPISGSTATVNILNSGGTTLTNGTSNGPHQIRSFAANLPPGTYYAQASGTGFTPYDITVTVTQ